MKYFQLDIASALGVKIRNLKVDFKTGCTWLGLFKSQSLSDFQISNSFEKLRSFCIEVTCLTETTQPKDSFPAL